MTASAHCGPQAPGLCRRAHDGPGHAGGGRALHTESGPTGRPSPGCSTQQRPRAAPRSWRPGDSEPRPRAERRPGPVTGSSPWTPVGRPPRCSRLLSRPVSAVVVGGTAAPARALWGGGACSLQTRKSRESPGRGQHATLVTGASARPSLGGTTTPATGPMVLHQDQVPTVDRKLMFPGGVGPAGRGGRRGAGSGLDAPCPRPSSGSCSQELRVGRQVALTPPGHAHRPCCPRGSRGTSLPCTCEAAAQTVRDLPLVTRPEPSAQLQALGAPARLSCPPARPTWPLPRSCPPRLPHASQGNVTRLEVVRSKSVSTWRFS